MPGIDNIMLALNGAYNMCYGILSNMVNSIPVHAICPCVDVEVHIIFTP